MGHRKRRGSKCNRLPSRRDLLHESQQRWKLTSYNVQGQKIKDNRTTQRHSKISMPRHIIFILLVLNLCTFPGRTMSSGLESKQSNIFKCRPFIDHRFFKAFRQTVFNLGPKRSIATVNNGHYRQFVGGGFSFL